MSGTFGAASNARVNCGGGLDGFNAGTIVSWVRIPDATPAARACLVSKGGADFRMILQANGFFNVRRNTSGTNNQATADVNNFAAFGLNKWLGYCATINHATAAPTLWLADETTTLPAEPSVYTSQDQGTGTPNNNSADDFLIGNEETLGEGWCDDIHSVAVYSDILTAAQMEDVLIALATGGDLTLGGTVTLLAALYVSHTGTITDESGNGNDGTPTNVTAEADAPSVATGAIAASLTGAASCSGTLEATGALAATLAGAGTASGTLVGTGALAAALAGVGTLTGTLTNGAPTGLAASLAGAATCTGTLTATGALATSLPGAATVTGTLTGRGALACSLAGAGGCSGTLDGTANLRSALAGAATLTGTMAGAGALACSLAGVATVTATLEDAGAVEWVLVFRDASVPAYQLTDCSEPVHRLTDASVPVYRVRDVSGS